MRTKTIPIPEATYIALKDYTFPCGAPSSSWQNIIWAYQAIQYACPGGPQYQDQDQEQDPPISGLVKPVLAGYFLARTMGANWIMYGRQGKPRILLPGEPNVSYTNPKETGGLQLDLSLLHGTSGLWNSIYTLSPDGLRSGVAITMSHLSTTSADISLEGFDRSSVTSVTPSQGFWLFGGMLIEAVRAASRGGEYYLEYIYKSQMDELAKGLR